MPAYVRKYSFLFFVHRTYFLSISEEELVSQVQSSLQGFALDRAPWKGVGCHKGAKVSQSRQDLQEVLALAEQLVPLHYDAEINAQQARHATTLSVVHRGASL